MKLIVKIPNEIKTPDIIYTIYTLIDYVEHMLLQWVVVEDD